MWHTRMGVPHQLFGGECRGRHLHRWLHCPCRCHGCGTHLVSCIVVVAVAEAWDSGGWQRAVGGAGWWWLRGRDVWHGLCLIWQVPKRSYVNINLYAKKCCCGAVGYITENIPIVLGSILACATFYIVLLLLKVK